MSSAYTAKMAHAAVARGAAWLDAKCPDWVVLIDLPSLALEDAQACVLGQTARCLLPANRVGEEGADFYTVMGYFDHVVDDWAAQHGFDADRIEFEMLQIAWEELIRQRLEARS